MLQEGCSSVQYSRAWLQPQQWGSERRAAGAAGCAWSCARVQALCRRVSECRCVPVLRVCCTHRFLLHGCCFLVFCSGSPLPREHSREEIKGLCSRGHVVASVPSAVRTLPASSSLQGSRASTTAGGRWRARLPCSWGRDGGIMQQLQHGASRAPFQPRCGFGVCVASVGSVAVGCPTPWLCRVNPSPSTLLSAIPSWYWDAAAPFSFPMQLENRSTQMQWCGAARDEAAALAHPLPVHTAACCAERGQMLPPAQDVGGQGSSLAALPVLCHKLQGHPVPLALTPSRLIPSSAASSESDEELLLWSSWT